jgi:putative peptide zinc metalloprotease protein
MTATAEPPVSTAEVTPARGMRARPPLDRAEGVELLGDIHGCGYRDGACLVRRADGQMLQLGPLMYGLLECIDGQRDARQLAAALSRKLGRAVQPQHVGRLAHKLAQQGLLKGTEHQAPPRRNPLLALRWKVLVTNPAVTRRLTAPFAFLFRPWLMWPVVACFVAVLWFVLVHKGVASATVQAFHRPGLLLLVFVLGVVSAGFHELGHASAARYGGATPGGMGVGLYLVWPAFYTDVTDAYWLPKRDRLRVDLGGLYFNAVVAVITMGVWLAVRSDALLLLVALQVLQMVKQLSPVIRADGYHILSDATGVPDLFAHLGPTLRRLLPGHRREPSALTGRARLLVTAWVLTVVPVLAALILGAVVLLPRLAATAWASGRHLVEALPHQVAQGQVVDVLVSLLSLLALALPVAGSILVTQRIVRSTSGKALAWSRGNPRRRLVVVLAAMAALAGIAWAWWPSGQYRPITANRGGTLTGLVKLVSAPEAIARPSVATAPNALAPGRHLAVAMIPVDGASRRHPALFIIQGPQHSPVVVLSYSAPKPPRRPARPVGGGAAAGGSAGTAPVGGLTGGVTASRGSELLSTSATQPASTGASSSTGPVPATAFPFKLPAAAGPGDTQALAVGTRNGGVTYDVAYALVTVANGAPVTNSNSAYALADCNGCTTVAVSFQLVLVIGQSNVIAPIDAAGALNYSCPACVTTAIADQLITTLKSQPSPALLATLNADLKQLNALPQLGGSATPAAVAAQVASIQQEIESQLAASGLMASPPTSSGASATGAATGAATAAPSSGTPTATGTTSTTPPTTTTSTTAAGTTPTTSTTSSATPTTTTSTTSSTPTIPGATSTTATSSSSTTAAP